MGGSVTAGAGTPLGAPSTLPTPGRPVAAMALVLAAASLFGTVGTARVLGPDASAWSVGALRLAAGAALLVAIAAASSAGLAGVRAAARRPAAWLAGLGMAAFQVTFLAAVELTGVALGTLVAIGSAPVFSGMITRVVSRAWVASTALALAGLALLTLGGSGGDGTVSPAGLALALGAGLSYATYTVASHALVGRGVHPAASAAAAFALAAVMLAPGAGVGGLAWATTGAGVGMVAWLALGPTALAYLLFNRGLRELPASTVSTLGLVELVVAAGLGVVVLGERLAPVALLGGALVVLGLLVLARSLAAPRRRLS